MYSIRHIIPEASSLPGTPTSSRPLDDNLSNFRSPILTPSITDFDGESHELLEYPFSPHNPDIPTTRPLQYPRKHHTGIRYISALSRSHAVNYGRIHENRHSLSYPSPTRTPTNASYNHFDRSPRHRDSPGIERPVQEHSPTRGNTEHLHISDSSTRSFAVPPPRLTVPSGGIHSRRTSSSQTVVGSVDPFNHHAIQLQNENTVDNTNGNTLLIASNHNYLRPTPILGRPPGPRVRAGFNRQERYSNGVSISKSHSTKLSTIKENRPDFPTRTYIVAFFLDTLPRQIYLYFLLCLPSMYFSRVSHIFEAAELSLPKIKQGVIDHATQSEQHRRVTASHDWRFGPPVPSTAYLNLQKTWELFVESLMREWRTLNVVSVLLLSYVFHFIIVRISHSVPCLWQCDPFVVADRIRNQRPSHGLPRTYIHDMCSHEPHIRLHLYYKIWVHAKGF